MVGLVDSILNVEYVTAEPKDHGVIIPRAEVPVAHNLTVSESGRQEGKEAQSQKTPLHEVWLLLKISLITKSWHTKS